MKLSQGKVTLVDDEDYEALTAFEWHARRVNGRWYAGRSVGKGRDRRVVALHRYILGLGKTPRTTQVDHVDGDGLNNTRANLRLCTPAQNAANRGPNKGREWKGVTYIKNGWKGKNWVAQMGFTENGKKCTKWLGAYTTPEEAQAVYWSALQEKFGEFASLQPKKGKENE